MSEPADQPPVPNAAGPHRRRNSMKKAFSFVLSQIYGSWDAFHQEKGHSTRLEP